MCESEVALEYFWTSLHVLQITTWSNDLIYNAESPNWVVSCKIDILPSILLPSLLFHSVTLECRDIVVLHPFHLGFRIKRPCTHWNSWFHPFKKLYTRNTYSAIDCTQKRRFNIYCRSHPCILYRSYLISTSFSLSSFINCVERQNVVVTNQLVLGAEFTTNQVSTCSHATTQGFSCIEMVVSLNMHEFKPFILAREVMFYPKRLANQMDVWEWFKDELESVECRRRHHHVAYLNDLNDLSTWAVDFVALVVRCMPLCVQEQ